MAMSGPSRTSLTNFVGGDPPRVLWCRVSFDMGVGLPSVPLSTPSSKQEIVCERKSFYCYVETSSVLCLCVRSLSLRSCSKNSNVHARVCLKTPLFIHLFAEVYLKCLDSQQRNKTASAPLPKNRMNSFPHFGREGESGGHSLTARQRRLNQLQYSAALI